MRWMHARSVYQVRFVPLQLQITVVGRLRTIQLVTSEKGTKKANLLQYERLLTVIQENERTTKGRISESSAQNIRNPQHKTSSTSHCRIYESCFVVVLLLLLSGSGSGSLGPKAHPNLEPTLEGTKSFSARVQIGGKLRCRVWHFHH
jgi:hypothetical protein